MTRDKIIEAIEEARRPSWWKDPGPAILNAICAQIPGLADVLDGKAVIVPKETTP